MPTALEIARHLYALATAGEEPEPLTPMRLHKLLYYCQGWSLAAFGRPMFAGRLEAWKSGPVEVDIYPLFAGSRAPIAPEALGGDAPPPELPYADAGLLYAVWRKYGRYSAYGLRDMTHDEAPWADARARAGVEDGEVCHEEIRHEDLAAFFRKVAEKDSPGLLDLMPPARHYESMAQAERGELRTRAEVFAGKRHAV